MEMDQSNLFRGRVRKKSAKVREMEEFEEEERKHGGKKSADGKSVTAGITPVPGSPPVSPAKKVKVKEEALNIPDAQVKSEPLSPSVGFPSSPGQTTPVSPQTDSQAKGSVIKLLLSSPVQQSTPAKEKKKTTSEASPQDVKKSVKNKKAGSGNDSAQGIKVELPALSVDTDIQSKAIVDEGSLKMKFILSPKDKPSSTNSSKKTTEKSVNPALLSMLNTEVAASGIKTKQEVLPEESDEDYVQNKSADDGKVQSTGSIPKSAKKPGIKRKLEQTVVVKTTPSSSVEYSLPAGQNLDYMDLASFNFDEDGELIIDDENKPKKLKKKIIKSPPKKVKPQQVSANNEFSLDDSQLASSDVAELAKRVKSAAEKKMGKKIKKSKTEEETSKDAKKKRPPTAYMLWCRVQRPTVVAESPGADFAQISKRLGEMWQTLSEKEKLSWKNRAKKSVGKGSTLISTGKTGGSRTGPPPAVTSVTPVTATTPTVKPKPTPEDPISPIKGFGTEPVDVAAHLKLVGESLCIIGVRLQEHRGLIAVQGSLSVLLDSMLCACGPLMCLTQQLPELDGCPSEVHTKTLDNIAYIMPGL